MASPERPHPPPIFTGSFRHGREYFLSRPGGTDDWLIVLSVAGCGRIRPGGGAELALPRHAAVLVRPRTGYEIRVDPEVGRWEWLWAHFLPRPAWREWLAWPETAPGMSVFSADDGAAGRRFRAAIAEMHALRGGALPLRAELAMNALEAALLRAYPAVAPSPLARMHPGIAAAMEYACRSLDRRITSRDLARAAGMSLSSLAHLFPRQVGTTPQRFVENERLERARQLLAATDLPVKAIAHQLGYDSAFYLTRRFTRAFGASPTAWRAGARGGRRGR